MSKGFVCAIVVMGSLTYGEIFAPDRVIVKLKPALNITQLQLPDAINKIEPIIKDNNPNPLAQELGLDLLYCLYFPATENVQQIIKDCEATGFFDYVEPDYIYQADNVVSTDQLLLNNFTLLSGTPNDPYYSSQWYLEKIKCHLAWDSVLGNPAYTVAIIDLGVNFQHEDLAATYAGGYDFQSNDTIPLPNAADPWGTMYAGIAAAHTNNNLGIASVSWGGRYLAYRCGDNGFIYISPVIGAVYDAVSKSASAIIFGFGGSSFSTSFNSAVQYAWQSGCILIGHAGSDSYGQIRYPAGYDNVIAVTASDQNDYLVSNANYGNWIDVVAPGANMITTTINGYGLAYTTAASIACVAGQVLLLKSKNPYLTNAQCVQKIFESCDSMPDPLYAQGMLGHGRINLFKMLMPLSDIEEQLSKSIYPKLDIRPNPFTSQTTIQYLLPALNNVSISIYDITGRVVKSFNVESNKQSTVNKFIWDGTNLQGQEINSGLYFVILKTGNKFVTTRIIKIN